MGFEKIKVYAFVGPSGTGWSFICIKERGI